MYHQVPTPKYRSFEARLQGGGGGDELPAEVSHLDTAQLPEDLVEAWNAYAGTLLSTAPLADLLHSSYITSKRPIDFQTAIALPLVHALTLSNLSSITPSQLLPDPGLAAPDSTLALLPSLSGLQLTLLIAACRLEIILSTDICSYEMAYEEYLTLVKKSKVIPSTITSSSNTLTHLGSSSGTAGSGGGGGGGGVVRSHGVARSAWQGLEDVGFLIPTATGWGGSSSSSKAGRDGRTMEGRCQLGRAGGLAGRRRAKA